MNRTDDTPSIVRRARENHGRSGDGGSQLSQESRNALTERDIADLCRDIESLRTEVSSLKADRDKALRWGILALGSAVLGMGTWIFTFITSHVPGMK